MRTAVRRVLVTLSLVLVSSVVVVLPARADLCATAPVPVSPKAGLVGQFTTPPENIPAAAPDPFKDPTIPLGDVYGFNWHWANYDLGCGSDFLRDPTAVSNTYMGNLLLSLADATTAGLASMERMARESPLDWLSNPLHEIVLSLRDPLLSKWFPLAAGALAVAVAWAARRSAYHQTAKTLGVFGASVALAAFALFYPVVLSDGVNKVVTVTSEAMGSVFSTSPTDTVNRESAYRTWLTGNFGDPDSPAAQKYGARLASDTQYTWSDWKRMQENPASKAEIDAAKAADFTQLAKSLKAEDPAAYEFFVGRGERTGPALYGMFSVAANGLFVAIAAFMVLVARVMMQVLTLLAPLVAVVAILPKQEAHLARLWDLFTACVVAVAKFTLAAGVMALVLAAVQSANLPGVTRLFFVIVVTVVGLVVTKPARSFKTLVPGLDPNVSYIKKFVSHVGPALAGGAGSYAGVVAGMDASEPESEPSKDLEAVRQESNPSLDPLPAPVYTVTQQPAAVSSRQSEPLAAVPAGSPSMASLPAGSGTEGRAEVAGAAEGRRALPVGTSGAEAPAGPEVGSAGATEPSDPPAPAPDRPVVTAQQADAGAVVEPTGIITQTDPGLYHSGERSGEYLSPVVTTELSEDGEEHERVVYHAASSEA